MIRISPALIARIVHSRDAVLDLDVLVDAVRRSGTPDAQREAEQQRDRAAVHLARLIALAERSQGGTADV